MSNELPFERTVMKVGLIASHKQLLVQRYLIKRPYTVKTHHSTIIIIYIQTDLLLH